MQKFKGFFALLFAGIIYSFNDICIRILGSSLSGYQQVTLRSLVGLILVTAIIIVRREKLHFAKTKKIIFLLYIIFFPIVFIFFNLSILLTKIADAVFSFSIGSLLFSLIVEKFLYKEKPDRIKILATFLTIIGLCFFTFPLSKINIGFALGLSSGIIYTFINALARHVHEKTNPTLPVLFQLIGGTFLGSAATALAGQSLFPPMSIFNLIILLVTGVTITLVTYLVLIGFKNFDLNLGTIVISSELFFAPLLAFLMFNEYLTSMEVLGGICIALAIIIPHLRGRENFR